MNQDRIHGENAGHSDSKPEHKKSFAERVAHKLIEQLKAGTAPWQLPWKPGAPHVFLPMNPTTDKRYKGINALQLASEGHNDPRWMTYKQASAMGAQIRKGEKGTPIQYWKFNEEEQSIDQHGSPLKEMVLLERPRVFLATVFNAEQMDGLPPLAQQRHENEAWNAIERAEAILKASGAIIAHSPGDRAFYRVVSDSITLPERGQFETANHYYATALHELGHWTGHFSRLNRDLAQPFGSQEYAKEELRAEIASLMLGDELGIGHDPGQHAAYVGAWIKVLEDDHLEIFRAAGDAEKIREYVLNFEQKQVQEQSPLESLQQDYAYLRNSNYKFDLAYEVDDQDHKEVGVPLTWRYEACELFDKEMGKAIGDPNYCKACQLSSDLHRYDKMRVEDPDRYKAIIAEKGQEIEASNAWIREHVLTNSFIKAQMYDLVSKQGGYYSDHYGQLVDDKEHYDYVVEMYLQMNTDSPAQVVAQANQFKDDLSADAQWAENSDKVLDKEVETTRTSTPEEIFQTSPMEVNLRNHMMKAAESDPKFAKDPVAKQRFHDFLTDIGLSRILKTFSPVVREQKPQEITYLRVPFQEKDQAKALGAQWDKEKRAWYVPEDMPLEGFSKWMAKDRQQQVGPSNRLYLIVPYSERGEAKSAGALWDNTVKSWYAGPRADQSRLQRWSVENVTRQQSPAMIPREEFASALKVLGCIVDAEHPIMDGISHRISVEGDKANQQSGFYVGYLDGCPAGYVKNNRTGVETRWKGLGYNLSQDEKAKLQAEATARLKERTEVQEQTQKLTAQRVVQQMERLVPIEQPTPYLVAKGIAVHAGVFTDQEGKTTFVPAFDADGKQWTMQYIQPDGTKRFAKEGRKDGCFHPVGGMDALAAAPVLMIAEGYATAASLAEATGQAVVAAFDSGNLESVARALHDKYPSKAVVIAGDDDRHLDMTHGINPGRSKAQAAAQAVGGKLLMPIFAPGENTYPADLHQFTPQEFLTNDEMKEELQAAQEGYLTLSAWQIERRQASLLTSEQMAAIEKMKAHTDFNDLACKSSLGKEGVQRQALAAIAQVLQTQNSQKSAHANTLKPEKTDKQQFNQSRRC